MREKKDIFGSQTREEFLLDITFSFYDFIQRVINPSKLFGNEFSAFHKSQLFI